MGRSALIPSHCPYTNLAIPQPTGGFTLGASANPENSQTNIEGDEAQVSNLHHSHLPRVTEWLIRRQGPQLTNPPLE